MTTKTKKSSVDSTNNVDVNSVKLAELKDFSLAFVREIDHIMRSQANGSVSNATGAKLLGNIVSQFEKTLNDKF